MKPFKNGVAKVATVEQVFEQDLIISSNWFHLGSILASKSWYPRNSQKFAFQYKGTISITNVSDI